MKIIRNKKKINYNIAARILIFQQQFQSNLSNKQVQKEN